MLVWRDTCEEQLGAGGILAVRTGPMGVPLVAPHRAFQRAGVTGHLQLPRLANPPRSTKDARKRFRSRALEQVSLDYVFEGLFQPS